MNYLPLDTLVMRRAAELWAATRKRGVVLADPKALDVDVILAAQALSVVEAGHDVTVATTNVKHLSLLIQAEEWNKIAP